MFCKEYLYSDFEGLYEDRNVALAGKFLIKGMLFQLERQLEWE
jgi:hypothetical protein